MSEIDEKIEQQADDPAATPAATSDEIIAGPDTGYRWKHLIVAVVMCAVGGWFAYDGWIKWPNQNKRIEQIKREKDAAQREQDTAKVEELAGELGRIKSHSNWDLGLQKVLALACPAFGLVWGLWTLHMTRGRLRMSGDTLEVPGHPPVTLENIRKIDKRKWDRKGIAFLHYEVGNPPKPGVLKLDDFAYERVPTDEILDRIEKGVMAGGFTLARPKSEEPPDEHK